ncbi:MAG TPA: hypothetical protein VGN86_04805 [Pyrinomonadaceae bacterium]|jgi:hypothetical protein|nr:hypothetical protein [Pyrinomonadaceae bacterium]
MMSQTLEFKQSSHLDPALSDQATIAANVEKLAGHWVNTNRETKGITECVIEPAGEELIVKLTGAGAEEPIAWPIARAKVLANLEEEAGQRTAALAVSFDFGFMKSETYIRINKGVLVIVLFNSFPDDSGRSSYVNREFFYRRD